MDEMISSLQTAVDYLNRVQVSGQNNLDLLLASILRVKQAVATLDAIRETNTNDNGAEVKA